MRSRVAALCAVFVSVVSAAGIEGLCTPGDVEVCLTTDLSIIFAAYTCFDENYGSTQGTVTLTGEADGVLVKVEKLLVTALCRNRAMSMTVSAPPTVEGIRQLSGAHTDVYFEMYQVGKRASVRWRGTLLKGRVVAASLGGTVTADIVIESDDVHSNAVTQQVALGLTGTGQLGLPPTLTVGTHDVLAALTGSKTSCPLSGPLRASGTLSVGGVQGTLSLTEAMVDLCAVVAGTSGTQVATLRAVGDIIVQSAHMAHCEATVTASISSGHVAWGGTISGELRSGGETGTATVEFDQHNGVTAFSAGLKIDLGGLTGELKASKDAQGVLTGKGTLAFSAGGVHVEEIDAEVTRTRSGMSDVWTVKGHAPHVDAHSLTVSNVAVDLTHDGTWSGTMHGDTSLFGASTKADVHVVGGTVSDVTADVSVSEAGLEMHGHVSFSITACSSASKGQVQVDVPSAGVLSLTAELAQLDGCAKDGHTPRWQVKASSPHALSVRGLDVSHVELAMHSADQGNHIIWSGTLSGEFQLPGGVTGTASIDFDQHSGVTAVAADVKLALGSVTGELSGSVDEHDKLTAKGKLAFSAGGVHVEGIDGEVTRTPSGMSDVWTVKGHAPHVDAHSLTVSNVAVDLTHDGTWSGTMHGDTSLFGASTKADVHVVGGTVSDVTADVSVSEAGLEMHGHVSFSITACSSASKGQVQVDVPSAGMLSLTAELAQLDGCAKDGHTPRWQVKASSPHALSVRGLDVSHVELAMHSADQGNHIIWSGTLSGELQLPGGVTGTASIDFDQHSGVTAVAADVKLALGSVTGELSGSVDEHDKLTAKGKLAFSAGGVHVEGIDGEVTRTPSGMSDVWTVDGDVGRVDVLHLSLSNVRWQLTGTPYGDALQWAGTLSGSASFGKAVTVSVSSTVGAEGVEDVEADADLHGALTVADLADGALGRSLHGELKSFFMHSVMPHLSLTVHTGKLHLHASAHQFEASVTGSSDTKSGSRLLHAAPGAGVQFTVTASSDSLQVMATGAAVTFGGLVDTLTSGLLPQSVGSIVKGTLSPIASLGLAGHRVELDAHAGQLHVSVAGGKVLWPSGDNVLFKMLRGLDTSDLTLASMVSESAIGVALSFNTPAVIHKVVSIADASASHGIALSLTSSETSTVVSLGVPLRVCVGSCSSPHPHYLQFEGTGTVGLSDGSPFFGMRLQSTGAWNNVMGLSFVQVTALEVDLRVAVEGFVPEKVGIEAALCLGSAGSCHDGAPHAVHGLLAASIDLTNPEDNYFAALINHLTIGDILTLAGGGLSKVAQYMPHILLEAGLHPYSTNCPTDSGMTPAHGTINTDCYAYMMFNPTGVTKTVQFGTRSLDVPAGLAYAGSLEFLGLRFAVRAVISDTSFSIDAEMGQLSFGGMLQIGGKVSGGSVVGGPRLAVSDSNVRIVGAISIPVLRSYGQVDVHVTDSKFSFSGNVKLFGGALSTAMRLSWDHSFADVQASLSDMNFYGVVRVEDISFELHTTTVESVTLSCKISVLRLLSIATTFHIQGRDLTFTASGSVAELVSLTVTGHAKMASSFLDSHFSLSVSVEPGLLLKAAAKAVAKAVGVVGGAVVKAVKAVDHAAEAAWSSAKQLFSAGLSWAKNMAVGLLEHPLEEIEDIVESLGRLLSKAADAIKDVADDIAHYFHHTDKRTHYNKYGCKVYSRTSRSCTNYVFVTRCTSWHNYGAKWGEPDCMRQVQRNLQELHYHVKQAHELKSTSKDATDKNRGVLAVHKDPSVYPQPDGDHVTGALDKSGTIFPTVTIRASKLSNGYPNGVSPDRVQHDQNFIMVTATDPESLQLSLESAGEVAGRHASPKVMSDQQGLSRLQYYTSRDWDEKEMTGLEPYTVQCDELVPTLKSREPGFKDLPPACAKGAHVEMREIVRTNKECGKWELNIEWHGLLGYHCSYQPFGNQVITVTPAKPVLTTPLAGEVLFGEGYGPDVLGTPEAEAPCGGEVHLTFHDSEPTAADGVLKLTRTWDARADSDTKCAVLASVEQSITLLRPVDPKQKALWMQHFNTGAGHGSGKRVISSAVRGGTLRVPVPVGGRAGRVLQEAQPPGGDKIQLAAFTWRPL